MAPISSASLYAGILLSCAALSAEAGSMKILNGVRMSSPNLINSTSTAVTSSRCALRCDDTNCLGVSWDSQTQACQTFEGSTVQGLMMSSAVTWTTFYRVGSYTANQRKTGSCPSGWIDQATAFGSCYKYGTSNMNWDQAKAYCDGLLPPYSKLAVIDNKQEDDYITSLIAAQDVITGSASVLTVTAPIVNPHFPCIVNAIVNVSADVGYITSPGYPSTYNNSQTCTWRISLTNNTKWLQFTAISFDLESCCDKVKLTPLVTGALSAGPYSGTAFNVLKFASSYVEVIFTTDSSVVLTGFQIRFEAIAAGVSTNPYVWLGGKRESGWFVWVVQNSFPLTAEYWSAGNPSSAAEECIDKMNSNYNYQWNDQSCASTVRALCELDLYSNQTKLYYS